MDRSGLDGVFSSHAISKRRVPIEKYAAKAVWFAVHRTLMSCAATLTVIAFVLILFYKKGQWTSKSSAREFTHSIVGLIVIIFAMIQPFMALFRCSPRWQIPFHLQLRPCYGGLHCLHPLHHSHLSGHVLHAIQLPSDERVDYSCRMVVLVACGLRPLRNHRSVLSTARIVGNRIEFLRSERLSSECTRKDGRHEHAV